MYIDLRTVIVSKSNSPQERYKSMSLYEDLILFQLHVSSRFLLEEFKFIAIWADLKPGVGYKII